MVQVCGWCRYLEQRRNETPLVCFSLFRHVTSLYHKISWCDGSCLACALLYTRSVRRHKTYRPSCLTSTPQLSGRQWTSLVKRKRRRLRKRILNKDVRVGSLSTFMQPKHFTPSQDHTSSGHWTNPGLMAIVNKRVGLQMRLKMNHTSVEGPALFDKRAIQVRISATSTCVSVIPKNSKIINGWAHTYTRSIFKYYLIFLNTKISLYAFRTWHTFPFKKENIVNEKCIFHQSDFFFRITKMSALHYDRIHVLSFKNQNYPSTFI